MANNQRSSNGGPNNMHSSNSNVISGGRTHDSEQNAFSELADVEKCSDAYLKQLIEQEEDLKRQLEVELKRQERLKQLTYEYESKIAVTKDKITDLGIPALEKHIEELKESIELTKKEVDKKSIDAINYSRETRLIVASIVNQFENRKLEFKSHEALMNGIKTKKVQADQCLGKIRETEAEIARLDRELARPKELINLDHARLILHGVEAEIEDVDKRLAKFEQAEQNKKFRKA